MDIDPRHGEVHLNIGRFGSELELQHFTKFGDLFFISLRDLGRKKEA
jgi:hypothetical protein